MGSMMSADTGETSIYWEKLAKKQKKELTQKMIRCIINERQTKA